MVVVVALVLAMVAVAVVVPAVVVEGVTTTRQGLIALAIVAVVLGVGRGGGGGGNDGLGRSTDGWVVCREKERGVETGGRKWQAVSVYMSAHRWRTCHRPHISGSDDGPKPT